MLGFNAEGSLMQILLNAVLMVYFLVGLVVAVPYTILVPPLILIFWSRPRVQNEQATTIGSYASLSVGAFVGLYLFVVLFVACNIPHHRQLKRTFQKWRGYDEDYKVIEN